MRARGTQLHDKDGGARRTLYDLVWVLQYLLGQSGKNMTGGHVFCKNMYLLYQGRIDFQATRPRNRILVPLRDFVLIYFFFIDNTKTHLQIEEFYRKEKCTTASYSYLYYSYIIHDLHISNHPQKKKMYILYQDKVQYLLISLLILVNIQPMQPINGLLQV